MRTNQLLILSKYLDHFQTEIMDSVPYFMCIVLSTFLQPSTNQIPAVNRLTNEMQLIYRVTKSGWAIFKIYQIWPI